MYLGMYIWVLRKELFIVCWLLWLLEEKMFPLFQHLPDDILLSIMSNWISFDDNNFRNLRKLDSTICEKQYREQYLRCLRILLLSESFSLYLKKKEASIQSLDQWIKSRGILRIAGGSQPYFAHPA